MVAHGVLALEVIERAAWITLSGTGGAPMTLEMGLEIRGAVIGAHANDGRVIILKADGPFFSVGGDLPASADAEALSDAVHHAIRGLVRSDAIVIAMVHAPTSGAGLPLAAAADIVLAGESATIGLDPSAVGLSDEGGTNLLVHTLGLHRTLALALLDGRLGAADAHAAGLVHEVVPDDGLLERTETVVSQLLERSEVDLARMKGAIRDHAG